MKTIVAMMETGIPMTESTKKMYVVWFVLAMAAKVSMLENPGGALRRSHFEEVR